MRWKIKNLFQPKLENYNIYVCMHEVKLEDMNLPERFLVESTVYKLPPLLKEYGLSVKHKRKDMRMQDLIIHLRIQEQHMN